MVDERSKVMRSDSIPDDVVVGGSVVFNQSKVWLCKGNAVTAFSVGVCGLVVSERPDPEMCDVDDPRRTRTVLNVGHSSDAIRGRCPDA